MPTGNNPFISKFIKDLIGNTYAKVSLWLNVGQALCNTTIGFIFIEQVKDTFHWLDYAIFTLMLLTSCSVGIYYAVTDSKKQNQEQFLMGNRKLKWLPVAISIVVSYNSAISQLGKPAELYLHGIQYFLSSITIVVASIITCFTFAPLLFKLKLTSFVERIPLLSAVISFVYLELRFQSKTVRSIGMFFSIISDVMYIGMALYSPAVALETVTGFPVWSSILFAGFVSTFYTTLGGMKAVVWTDTLQWVVMVGGMLAVIITGMIQVGGFRNVLSDNRDNGRFHFNISFDPTIRMTVWAILFGSSVRWIQSYSATQAAIQRFCSVPTLKNARLTLLANGPLLALMDMLTCLVGMVIYSYFSKCDPLNHPDIEKRLSSPNQLLPYFVMKVMGWPGVPGIFLATIFSASLSTVSSCLSSLATITWEDLLKWKFINRSDRVKTFIIKAVVVWYGLCSVGMAFLTSLLKGSVLQVNMSILDAAASPLLGLFILGAYFTRSNWLGAIVGSAFGFALPMWMSVGSYLIPESPQLNTSTVDCVWNRSSSFNFTTFHPVTTPIPPQPIEGIQRLYTVSFMWFPVIGTLTTVLVGMVVSLAAAPFIRSIQPGEISKKYLIFPLDRFSHTEKNRSEKTDTTDGDEMKPLS